MFLGFPVHFQQLLYNLLEVGKAQCGGTHSFHLNTLEVEAQGSGQRHPAWATSDSVFKLKSWAREVLERGSMVKRAKSS